MRLSWDDLSIRIVPEIWGQHFYAIISPQSPKNHHSWKSSMLVLLFCLTDDQRADRQDHRELHSELSFNELYRSHGPLLSRFGYRGTRHLTIPETNSLSTHIFSIFAINYHPARSKKPLQKRNENATSERVQLDCPPLSSSEEPRDISCIRPRTSSTTLRRWTTHTRYLASLELRCVLSLCTSFGRFQDDHGRRSSSLPGSSFTISSQQSIQLYGLETT
jgi:hypothetical protein